MTVAMDREVLAREMRAAAIEAIKNAEALAFTGSELSMVGWTAAAGIAIRECNAAAEGMQWRPIVEAVDDHPIIALAHDGSVYAMEMAPNHRGEVKWITWAGVGFIDGYITHFIRSPHWPRALPVDGGAE